MLCLRRALPAWRREAGKTNGGIKWKLKQSFLRAIATKVTVTIDAATVSNRIKAQYKDFAGRYRIPGFRKGKAPRQVIDNFLGKEAVVATVTDSLVNDTCMQACDKAGLYPLGQPQVRREPGSGRGRQGIHLCIRGAASSPLSSFPATTTVEIEMPSAEVTEDEVNAEIDAMLTHYSEYSNAAANKKFADGNMAEIEDHCNR